MITVQFGESLVNVSTYDSSGFDSALEAIKSVYGAIYFPERRTWRMPLRRESIDAISTYLDPSGVTIMESELERAKDFPTDVSLYDFQKEDASFLYSEKRALLGNPMAAGKTICALALFKRLKDEGKVRRGLVVALSTILPKWKNEATLFNIPLRIEIVGGLSPRKRAEIYSGIDGIDLVISSYGLLLEDLDAFRDIGFDFVVMDEPTSKYCGMRRHRNATSKAAKELARGAQYVYFATGTPFVNRLEELHNLIDILRPGYFGSLSSFASRYIVYEDAWFGGRRVRVISGYKNEEEVRARLRGIMVRRERNEIEMLRCLPPIIYNTYFYDLLPRQLEVYKSIKRRVKEIRESGDGVSLFSLAFEAINVLRDCCLHTRMVAERNSFILTDEMRRVALDADCGVKLDAVKEMISSMPSDDKAVLYSEFTRFVRIVSDSLVADREDAGAPFIITGDTPSQKRQGVLDEFRDSVDRNVLLSSEVLSYGLDIPFANHAIHLNIPWAPDVIDQRNARLQRKGQLKSIDSVFMHTKGTVEEHKVLKIVREKLMLFSKVVGSGYDDLLEEITKESS